MVHARRLLTLACATLAFAGVRAAAAEPASAYPATQVLDAVRTACSDLSSRDKAASRIVASGWTKSADPAATPVGPLVQMGYAAGRKLLDASGGRVDDGPLVYTRQVASETLHLVLSSISVDGTAVVGCRAYDVGETRKIGKNEAAQWFGSEPSSVIEQTGLTKYTWDTGMLPGQDSFDIFYVPAGSPLIAMVKVSGIAIKADQVSELPR